MPPTPASSDGSADPVARIASDRVASDRVAPASVAPKRVIVIGAGIVGVCCARFLQREGHRVTLLDRGQPGQGASFGNASVFATESVVPVATPGIWRKVPGMLRDPLGPLALRWGYLPQLAPWLLRFLAASGTRRVEEISHALKCLLDGSLDDYRLLLAEIGADDLLVRRGWLAAYTTAAALGGSRHHVGLQRRHGVEVAEVSTAEMRQMEPALSRDLVGGYYYPDVAHTLDNLRVVTTLAEALARDGGRILCRDVTGFTLGPGGVKTVETTEDALECDAVVVAAGAWSKELARRLGAKVPLDTERGYHLTFPDPQVELTRPIISGEYGFVATPRAAGLRIAGTVEMGGLHAPPNWQRARVLAERGRQILPDLATGGAERWMGFRPSLPDSLPVIGPAPGAPNAVLAFGHGHLGLTLGARTGRLVADLVAGRPASLDIAPFAADRF
jgi:D-amino-acid dehydrogenase